MRFRAWLLILAYALLVFIVAFGAWWTKDQFDQAHRNECSIASAEASIAGVNLAVADGSISEHEKALLNDAIRELNSTCGFDLKEIP